jgi:hypothetical protein
MCDVLSHAIAVLRLVSWEYILIKESQKLESLNSWIWCNSLYLSSGNTCFESRTGLQLSLMRLFLVFCSTYRKSLVYFLDCIVIASCQIISSSCLISLLTLRFCTVSITRLRTPLTSHRKKQLSLAVGCAEISDNTPGDLLEELLCMLSFEVMYGKWAVGWKWRNGL